MSISTKNLVIIYLSLMLVLTFTTNSYAVKVLNKKESPCIEFVEPIPYNPDSMYMSYFEYAFTVASSVGTPGVDYPTMYLYAYNGSNLENPITTPKPIDFINGENNGSFTESVFTSFNIEDLTSFYSLCENPSTVTLTGNYKVTAVAIVNGTPFLYHELYPELFPNNQFDVGSHIVDVFHYFYCDFTPYSSEENNGIDNNKILKHSEKIESLSENIKVFPNPFEDNLFIDLQHNQDIQIQIFSVSGVLLHTQLLRSEIDELNLNFLDSGIYYINIICNNNKYYKKVIKK